MLKRKKKKTQGIHSCRKNFIKWKTHTHTIVATSPTISSILVATNTIKMPAAYHFRQSNGNLMNGTYYHYVEIIFKLHYVLIWRTIVICLFWASFSFFVYFPLSLSRLSASVFAWVNIFRHGIIDEINSYSNTQRLLKYVPSLCNWRR